MAYKSMNNSGELTPIHNNALKNSSSGLNVRNLNYRDVEYQDYDLMKQTKALEHTYLNFDGGQNFYK